MLNQIPEKGKKPILIWLLIGMIMIVLMIAIGGITRLTHSGLSMVDWKPLMGAIPPISAVEWQSSFELYQQYPEYQENNFDMTIEEYKKIFFWEYLHRLWGRIMGIIFIIPFMIFWKKGYLKQPIFNRLIWILIGGGLVGGLGWFMVVSGLKDKPEVSHYRLAIHLIAAFSLLVYIYWQFLLIKYDQGLEKNNNVLKWPKWLIVLAALQIIYGAFVAGLKAGLVHNTFPLMGNSFVHENTFSLSPFWENLVNHKDGVQFIHRILAYSLLVLVAFFGLKYRKLKGVEWLKSLNLAMIIVTIQFLLGVTTLLMHVPVSIGVLHQFGAILLLLVLFRVQFFNKYSVT
jgi:cytochrome c oxidase assembly protein subunit 15